MNFAPMGTSAIPRGDTGLRALAKDATAMGISTRMPCPTAIAQLANVSSASTTPEAFIAINVCQVSEAQFESDRDVFCSTSVINW